MNKISGFLNKYGKFHLFLFTGLLLFIIQEQIFASENLNAYLNTPPLVRISSANDAIQPPGREPTDRETSNIFSVEIVSSLTDRPVLPEIILGGISIPLFGSEYKRFWTGFEFSHAILTPEHPEEGELKPKERPPAGLLLYNFTINGENDEIKIYRKFGFWAGVIGPLSRADQLQSWFHTQVFRNGQDTLCWKNEIGDIPVFIFGMEQSQKLYEYHPWFNDQISFKTITKIGLYLGTSNSAGSLIEFQLGWNPDRHNQYGVTRIGPQYIMDMGQNPSGLGRPLSSAFLQSFFAFSSLRLDLIVNDQTLIDRDITPRPIVLKLIYGFGLVLNLCRYPVSLSLAATIESRRYDEQKDIHSFLTLSVSGGIPYLGGRAESPSGTQPKFRQR